MSLETGIMGPHKKRWQNILRATGIPYHVLHWYQAEGFQLPGAFICAEMSTGGLE